MFQTPNTIHGTKMAILLYNRNIHAKLSLGIIVLIAYLLQSCASVTNPEGGPKDEVKPKLLSISPPNQSTNYKGNTITLNFDEPITINDLNQQLIITPTITSGYKSEVTSKKLTLTFNKALAENTTYFLALRAGIKDLTEGNVPDSCEFAFSTGPYIDSNTVNGLVLDPVFDKVVDDAVVALYRDSDTLNIQKQNPLYICRSDKEGKFKFRNLPSAEFRLFAYNDANKDLKYTNKTELLGFLNHPINSAKDTSYQLRIVAQNLDSLKLYDNEAGLNKTSLNFSKGIETFRITSSSAPDQRLAVSKGPKKVILSWPKVKHDSIQIRYQAKDSTGQILESQVMLHFSRTRPATEKSVVVYTFDQQTNQKIIPDEGISLLASDSITKVNKDKFKVLFDGDTTTDQDKSLTVNETGTRLTIKTEKRPKSKLRLVIAPNAIVTLHDSTNHTADTLDYGIAEEAEFGIIHTICTGKPPFLIQVLDGSNNVVRSVQNKAKYDFTWLPPSTYLVRYVEDSNKNGRWDAGNVILGTLPERIVYYKEKILVKQNWEIDEITLP
jgi:hypothetical protein